MQRSSPHLNLRCCKCGKGKEAFQSGLITHNIVVLEKGVVFAGLLGSYRILAESLKKGDCVCVSCFSTLLKDGKLAEITLQCSRCHKEHTATFTDIREDDSVDVEGGYGCATWRNAEHPNMLYSGWGSIYDFDSFVIKAEINLPDERDPLCGIWALCDNCVYQLWKAGSITWKPEYMELISHGLAIPTDLQSAEPQ